MCFYYFVCHFLIKSMLNSRNSISVVNSSTDYIVTMTIQLNLHLSKRIWTKTECCQLSVCFNQRPTVSRLKLQSLLSHLCCYCAPADSVEALYNTNHSLCGTFWSFCGTFKHRLNMPFNVIIGKNNILGVATTTKLKCLSLRHCLMKLRKT